MGRDAGIDDDGGTDEDGWWLSVPTPAGAGGGFKMGGVRGRDGRTGGRPPAGVNEFRRGDAWVALAWFRVVGGVDSVLDEVGGLRPSCFVRHSSKLP
jgi:hypothetical protein